MNKIKRMPDNVPVEDEVDTVPTTKNRRRGHLGPQFEEDQSGEIPNFGVERQDNVGTEPDYTRGRNGPDDF